MPTCVFALQEPYDYRRDDESVAGDEPATDLLMEDLLPKYTNNNVSTTSKQWNALRKDTLRCCCAAMLFLCKNA